VPFLSHGPSPCFRVLCSLSYFIPRQKFIHKLVTVRMNYQEARPEHLRQQRAGLNMCTRWLLAAIMILVIRSTLHRMMIRLMVANRPKQYVVVYV
jgi:hypothetical protein